MRIIYWKNPNCCAKMNEKSKINSTVLLNENHSAVSPVIATVLMVSITVILAAIIATFMFGMVGSMPITRTVAFTISQPSADEITVVYNGGPDAALVKFSTVIISPSGGAIGTYNNNSGTGLDNNIIGNAIGGTVTASSGNPQGFAGRDHVIVTAHFLDGHSQVALDAIL